MGDKYYWLASDDPAEIVSRLSKYHGTWNGWGANPVSQAWVRNAAAYYSPVIEASTWETALSFEGEQGELVKMFMPEARSLVRQLVALVTKQQLNFTAIAESMGQDVVQEMRLGKALFQQIVEEESLDIKGEDLVEQALVFGSSFMKACWRMDKGRPAGREGNRLMYDGDLEISVHNVFDVFYDSTIASWKDLDWVEIRVKRSRWALIAQFPDMEDEILALPSVKLDRDSFSGRSASVGEDDYVYVYELYHKLTPALPNGRMLIYGSDKAVFYDGVNPYEEIPIEPMMPSRIVGMGYGYPFLSDLLPAQEMLDNTFSSLATNQAAFAVQNIAVPRSAGISVEEISGMNFISYTPTPGVQGGGKPEALQLLKSSPESFKFIDYVLSRMQAHSSLNSALRGEPPPGVTAGTAIATLSANALEFINPIAKSYRVCLEKVMRHALMAYKRFAQTPHIISITGRNNKALMRKFTGQDLEPLRQVKMQQINPLMGTLAGRLQIAETLIQSGMVTQAKEYISILDGQPLDTLMDVELSEMDLMHSENEALMEGREVIALATDDHAAHVREHHKLLNDPEIRLGTESAKLEMILAHIMEHVELAKTTDPMLQAMVRTGTSGQPQQPGQMPAQPTEPSPMMELTAEEEGLPTEELATESPDLLGR